MRFASFFVEGGLNGKKKGGCFWGGGGGVLVRACDLRGAAED